MVERDCEEAERMERLIEREANERAVTRAHAHA